MAKKQTIKTDEAIDTQVEDVDTSDEQETKPATKKQETKPASEVQTPARPMTKAEIMKDKLSKQPKVRIFIPLEKGESKNAVETVILNGYRLNIKKGSYVDVPQQVADIIKDGYQQTIEAQNNALRSIPESERIVLDNSNS